VKTGFDQFRQGSWHPLLSPRRFPTLTSGVERSCIFEDDYISSGDLSHDGPSAIVGISYD
jgi:hypothetical protein